MKLTNLFEWSYWFNQPVIAARNVYWVWLLGLLFIAALGLGSLIYSTFVKVNLNKIVFKKIGDLFSTLGIVGLIFFFFRQQSIPFFGLRFWFLLWFVWFAAWLYKVLKYLLKRVPEIKIEQEQKARKEKYLPGKN